MFPIAPLYTRATAAAAETMLTGMQARLLFGAFITNTAANAAITANASPHTPMKEYVNIIMKDLIKLMSPKYIEVWGKFLPRGGLSIDPYCNYGIPGTKWERLAWDRLAQHDMYPETVNNR